MQRLADVGANNWVCKTEESVHDMLTKLYESPEFVRYGVFTGDLVLEHMIDSKGYSELADPIGKLMSTAMTTFFSLPSARAISLALSTFFHVPAATSAPAGNQPTERFDTRQLDQGLVLDEPRLHCRLPVELGRLDALHPRVDRQPCLKGARRRVAERDE